MGLVAAGRRAEQALADEPRIDPGAVVRLARSVRFKIGREPGPDGVRDLCRRIAQAGIHARRLLLRNHQRTVVNLASSHRASGLDFLALVGEGNLGMMRALDTYDRDRDPSFPVYAAWWMHQAMARASVDRHRSLQIPEAKAEQLNRILRAQAQLVEERVRQPSADEIARKIGSTVEEVQS